MDALLATITLLDQWLKGNDTNPDLRECIYEYAMGRGEVLMENICLEHGYDEHENGKGTRFNRMEKVHGGNGEQGNVEYPAHSRKHLGYEA